METANDGHQQQAGSEFNKPEYLHARISDGNRSFHTDQFKRGRLKETNGLLEGKDQYSGNAGFL
jgi:hypothetical protein